MRVEPAHTALRDEVRYSDLCATAALSFISSHLITSHQVALVSYSRTISPKYRMGAIQGISQSKKRRER
jgi:hypothetical protein